MLAAALATVSVGAFEAGAADMPAKAPVAAAPFNWTSCHIGGNAGVASARASFTTAIDVGGIFGTQNRNIIGAAGTGTTRKEGFIGGGQIGCDWQTGRYVLGIEGDTQWLSTKPTIAVTGALFTGDPFTISNSVKNDWLATVRARAGFASERSLIYVTGGAAFTEAHYVQAFSSPVIGPVTGTFNISRSQTGWTIGGGWEYAITSSWSFKAEYLHVRFPTINVAGLFTNTASGNTQVVRGSLRETIDIARIGLNYRIGGPILARN